MSVTAPSPAPSATSWRRTSRNARTHFDESVAETLLLEIDRHIGRFSCLGEVTAAVGTRLPRCVLGKGRGKGGRKVELGEGGGPSLG